MFVNALSLLSWHCNLCHRSVHISYPSLLILSHLDVEVTLCTIEICLQLCKYLGRVYTATIRQDPKEHCSPLETDTDVLCIFAGALSGHNDFLVVLKRR